MTIAFIFPGQGSQAPGSGIAWQEEAAWVTVAEASEASGRDVAHLLLAADADELVDTANAQLSTFVISLVAAQALIDAGITPSATAGHSLGEYTALAAGFLSPGDGAALVAARGEAMRVASAENPGTMAAVLGLDVPTVTGLSAELDGEVWVANDNAPGQVVVAGSAAAIADLEEPAKAAGARKPMPLKVAAFHTPYMSPAQGPLDEAIKATNFTAGTATPWANVDATAHTEPSDWPALLSAQLCSPVQWRNEIEAMAASGVETFIEVGPGTVLSGMVKRIAPDAGRFSVSAPEQVAEVVQNLR